MTVMTPIYSSIILIFRLMSLYTPLLAAIGLSDGEAQIYQILLENGRTKARDVVELSDLGRPNVYHYLSLLEKRGLLTVIQGKQQQYEAVDPTALRKLIEGKKQDVAEIEARFTETLPKLSSLFSLSTGKPTVEIFEGIDGAKQAIEDTLRQTGEILTILDPEAITGPLQKIDDHQYKMRIKKGVPKRILLADTESVRTSFVGAENPLTQVRFSQTLAAGTKCTVQIYGNTVSFITLTEHHLVSVIIRDPLIASQQQALFEALWQTAQRADGTRSKTT